MKYIPEIILAISTCALGIGASAFIKEDNRHIISIIAGTLGIVALFAFLLLSFLGCSVRRRYRTITQKPFLLHVEHLSKRRTTTAQCKYSKYMG